MKRMKQPKRYVQEINKKEIMYDRLESISNRMESLEVDPQAQDQSNKVPANKAMS